MNRVLLERTSRTKLVNFRLSDEEVAYLVEKAGASGARSVSEYVRLSALDVAGRELRRRDAVKATSPAQTSGGNGVDHASMRLVVVLRALEDALREARREIVKD